MSKTIRRIVFVVLGVTLALLVVGVLVFRRALGLSWVDSVYFVVTTFTGVGYGDISLREASGPAKMFGVVLMVGGVASMAAAFAILVELLLRSQLEAIFGRRRRRMKDHTVLCGLGNVGVRTLEHLRRMGEQVVVIEKKEDARFLNVARKMGAPVVAGDACVQTTLEEADIRAARCLIAVTDNDVVNLEAALNARSIRPDIRIVLRVFDHNFATKIKEGFDIGTAFSTSALAAPAFAMASIDASVVGSFFVGEDVMVNVELVVSGGSKLSEMATTELMAEGHYVILAHECARTKKRTLGPSRPVRFAAGDRVFVAMPREGLARLRALNEAGSGGEAEAG